MKLRIHVINNFYSSNIGWALLVISTLGFLEKNFPNIDCTIESLYPQQDSKNYPWCRPVRPVKSSLKTLVSCLARAFLWRILHGLRVNADTLLSIEPLNSLKEADVVLDLSGDGLCPAKSVSLRYRLRRTISTLTNMISILIALVLGKRVILFSQSICNLGVLKPLASLVLRKAELIVVRDQGSLRYLSELGIGHNIVLATDASFSLKIDENIPEKNEPMICISPSYEAAKFFYKHGLDKTKDLYVRLIEYLVKNHQARVKFIPSSIGGKWKHEDDRVFIDKIIEDIDSEMVEKHVRVVRDIEPKVLIRELAECDLSVVSRMHPSIVSLLNARPVVAIVHSDKFRAVTELFKPCVEQVEPDNAAFGNIIEKLESLLASEEECREIIISRLEIARRLSINGLETLVKTLREIEAEKHSIHHNS